MTRAIKTIKTLATRPMSESPPSKPDSSQYPNESPHPGIAKEAELADGRMAFSGHIRELRDRLRNAVIALTIGFAISLKFAEDIFVILARPIQDAWLKLSPDNEALGSGVSFYFHGLIDPFWAYFSIAFWSGIFIASPVIFYQVWKFISPGLYKNERRWGFAFATVSAMLFFLGATFCYYIVLPTVCEFLLGYSNNNLGSANITLLPELTIRDYFDFAKRLLIGFGLIFELPLVILVMSIMGLVTHRSLWKFNRWAILLSFVISAALTPPDIYSQMFMAGPLIVLYNISIILAFFVTLSKERKQKAMNAEPDADIDEGDKGDE